jgi:hypothetical protein
MPLDPMPGPSLTAARRVGEVDVDESRAMPLKTFTVSEANGLIPVLEEVLIIIDGKMEAVHGASEQLHILDVLWGPRILAPDNPDYAEARRLRLEIATLVREIEDIVRRDIEGRGLRFPQGGLEHGLIDFPTTWLGREVYLCWRRGEPEVEAWHEVDAGFAGRRILTPEHVRRMGVADDSTGTGPARDS